ncbi:hypothetical protein HPB48_019375 [Haemaphysalis longicornis]|uniref:Fibronectin type-III domain-containing protein n=1 Tax=Haemaphysalis longicornis TaxID=44386 RepID=A0A9J6FVM7_HAELO|nr:hypothetical protein HPB48_019375 [Haemaphysalis longicornis]
MAVEGVVFSFNVCIADSGITEADDEPWGITVTPPDTVTLHWGPPARGMIQALSYIVEKRDPSDQDWVPVVIVDAHVTSCVIRELNLREEHWFRVLARSSMGLTSVLETDRPVQLREETCKFDMKEGFTTIYLYLRHVHCDAYMNVRMVAK